MPLALAPRAEAFVYYVNYGYPVPGYHTAIARAHLDGTGVSERFIDVAPGYAGVGGVAVDAEHIYWATVSCSSTCNPTPAIARAKLDGSGVDESFITVEDTPFAIAVDAHHLYWVDEDGIARANLDGTGVDPNFITPPTAPPAEIAVDAEHIYWTQFVVPGPPPPRPPPPRSDAPTSTARASTRASSPSRPPTPGDWPSTPSTSTGTRAPTPAFNDATIGRANLDGSGINQSLIQAPGTALAVDAAHLYWSGNLVGPHPTPWIGRANLDGTGVDPSIVKEPGGQVGAIAVNFSVGKLKKANNKGTAKLTLEVPAPGEIALAQTKKLKGAEVRAEAAGEVQLAIKPRGKAKKKLAKKGKVKVGVEVTYTPDGGEPEAQIATLRLKR